MTPTPTWMIIKYDKNASRFRVNQTRSNRNAYKAAPTEKVSQGNNPNFIAAASNQDFNRGVDNVCQTLLRTTWFPKNRRIEGLTPVYVYVYVYVLFSCGGIKQRLQPGC
jgi:hypothetical protein